MSLNDFNYVHVGTDYITEELWVNIIQNETVKPIGGLWTSPFNNVPGSISDWTDLLLEKQRLIEGYPYQKGCLIKINENSNIYQVECNWQAEQLKQNYFKNQTIDYEKLSRLYDALFIAPFSLSYSLRHGIFKNWDVRTLLIFNLGIIDSYIPISIEKKDGGFYISEKKTPRIVDPTSIDYINLSHYIKELFDQELNHSSYHDIKQNIIQAEHQIYSLILEKLNKRINPNIDNYFIIKAILLNEKHKQYVKRK